MAGFFSKLRSKLEEHLPNTIDSVGDTVDALRYPSESGLTGGGVALGAIVGGVLGLGLGIAATVGSIFAAPLATLALMHFAGAAVLPFIGAFGLGTIGAGIGYVAGAVARVGFGAIGTGFAALMDLGNAGDKFISRRTKDYVHNTLKFGIPAGALLGLGLGIAAFVAAPAVGTTFGIFTSIMGGIGAIGGLGAIAAVPVALAANVIDKIRGKDLTPNGVQERQVKDLLDKRNDRLCDEKTAQEYADKGWMPHIKDALPQDVYARLSDDGKRAALAPVFNERGDIPAVDNPADPKVTKIFNRFAQNARNILASEQDHEKSMSDKERRDAAYLARARDKALEDPKNRVVRDVFGEVRLQY